MRSSRSPNSQSPGEVGSSQSRTSATTVTTAAAVVDTTVVKSVGAARPPDIARYSATTAATTVAKLVGEARPLEGVCNVWYHDSC